MSNFICDKCGKSCIDSPKGYVSGCEHYPADNVILFSAYSKQQKDEEVYKRIFESIEHLTEII